MMYSPLLPLSEAGHILSRVYNCTENFIFHLPTKISDDLF